MRARSGDLVTRWLGRLHRCAARHSVCQGSAGFHRLRWLDSCPGRSYACGDDIHPQAPARPVAMGRKPTSDPGLRIGWREWVSLPDLGIETIKAKVDTGARTSSLHAFNLQEFRRDGRDMVRFEVHPEQKSTRHASLVEARLHDRRTVKSSTGDTQVRPVIRTRIEILDRCWEVELTLTARDEMGFRMLLGRQAIRGRFAVDPGTSFLNGRRAKGTRRFSNRRKPA